MYLAGHPIRRLLPRLDLTLAAVIVLACGVGVAAKPTLVGGAIAGLLFMGITFARPHVGVGFWLVATIFVPAWTVVGAAGIPMYPSYLAIPVVVAVLFRLLIDKHMPSVKLVPLDGVIVLAVLIVVSFHFLYGQNRFLATNVAITLFGGYVVGRISSLSAQKVFCVAMVIVSFWGIFEFAFDWHAFTGWQAPNGIGPALQERGGYTRSEATLGHAIAYGACLAAALPFTRLFKHPVVLQVILAAGVIVSFSRGPMIAVLVTIALMFYVERTSKHRLASGAMLAIGLVVGYFIFSFLYSGTGQSELESSSSQRDRQISKSIDYVNVFGPADGTQLNSHGQYVTNGVNVVDSVWLRLGLDFGWFVCALLLLPVVLAAGRVLIRRAGPASVALAGQIPVLVVTSFITQWQIIFFFLCGIAATEIVGRGVSPDSRPSEVKERSLT